MNWASYLDNDSFDLTEDGTIIACIRKPPAPRLADYPWYAAVRLSDAAWDMGVIGFFPCEKFARMAADAYIEGKRQ